MDCYEAIDLMGDALENTLAVQARSGLEEHLEECPACRNYYEQLQLTCRALRNLPSDPATSSQRSDLIVRFRKEFH